MYFSRANKAVKIMGYRQRMYEEIFGHATESILVTDETGYIVLINPATERFFQYRHVELEGKTVEYLLPDRFVGNHVKHRQNYNRNPHSRSMGIGMDLYAKRKDGSEFPVEISLSPFTSDGRNFIIAFIIDITKRKEVEEANIAQQLELQKLAVQLRSSNEKLESTVDARTKVLSEALKELERSKIELSEALEKEKELNELKSRFISMASHEFRTPLTTILSSASLIPEYPAQEQQEKRLKHVVRIQSAVNNLNDILSDFLSISKIEEGKVNASNTELNLRNLLKEVTTEMKSVVRPGQQIIYTHSGDEVVSSDMKLIRNIVINLISNAIKFSEENKRIEVSTEVNKEHFTITVADQGIGISEEDKKHLFERFFRGQNVTNIHGTGLGLNIISSYVELMNGFIEMESQLEKGTTVKITIPVNK
jgi:PAS domain S-box-containing protein